MNTVLLLTGTVEPENMILTRLLDPQIRKKQYLDALDFWLRNTNLQIVFVENSNTDLSSYFSHAIYSKRLEILTFKDLHASKELGKGYGEMNCMQFAHDHSKFLKNATFIFKMTGRLKLLNFKSFSKGLSGKDAYVAADLAKSLDFADSRFWGYKPGFFSQCLTGFQNMLNDSRGIYFEHILAQAIIKSIKQGKSFSAFNTRLRIEGVSGTSNKQYNASFTNWYLRDLIKKVRYPQLIKSLERI